MDARRLLVLLIGALAAAAPGCLVGVAYQRSAEVFVFSEPEGATVLMDGKDTGFTTPAKLGDVRGVISVEKPGYTPRSQQLQGRTSYRFPRWNDGGTGTFGVKAPLFWVLYDVEFPNQITRTSEPHRLYFKLDPVETK